MKKIWVLATILMIIFTFYQIFSSYAKYIANANGDIEKSIGKWIIKVNNEDISNGTEEQNFEINQLQYNSNNYVKPGKIAPGLIGYFDIEIDANSADVAVIYDVTIDFSELDISDSIKFSRLVKVVNGEEQSSEIYKTGQNTYTGIIEFDNAVEERKDLLRVYVEWENDETGINDEADSELGKQINLKLPLMVNVKVSQYLGETIEEYIEP